MNRTVSVSEKEATLIAIALQAYAEDLTQASDAVISPFLKRGFKFDAGLVTNLIGRFDAKAADKVIREFLDRHDKIGAIKYYRTVTCLGLKEAKDYVDAFELSSR